LATTAGDSSSKGMKLRDLYQADTVLHADAVDTLADYTALLVHDALPGTVGGEAYYKLQKQIKKETALDAVAVKAMVDAQVTYIALDLAYATGI